MAGLTPLSVNTVLQWRPSQSSCQCLVRFVLLIVCSSSCKIKVCCVCSSSSGSSSCGCANIFS